MTHIANAMVVSTLKTIRVIGICQRRGGLGVTAKINRENVDQKHQNCRMVESRAVIPIQKIIAVLTMATAAVEMIFVNARDAKTINIKKKLQQD